MAEVAPWALRFPVFGIPVAVDLSFFLVIGLLGWAGDVGYLLMWLAIAFVSILVHELGHAVTAKWYGSTVRIQLYAFGGLTTHDALTLRRGLVVTLAGPGVGIALGLLVYAAATVFGPVHGDVSVAVQMTIWINIVWGLANLLPVLPLDGGNALRDVIEIVTGADRLRLVRQISIGVAALAAVAALAFGYPYSALFAVFFVGLNLKELSGAKATNAAEKISAAARELEEGDARKAWSIADEVMRFSPDAHIVGVSAQLKAWACFLNHDVEGARDALRGIPDSEVATPQMQGALLLADGDRARGLAFVVDGWVQRAWQAHRPLATVVSRADAADELLERLLLIEPEVGLAHAANLQLAFHRAGAYDDAVTYGRRLRTTDAPTQTAIAYNLACSLARLGRTDEALDWLATAIESGFTGDLGADPDLTSLRTHPRFAELQSSTEG